MDTGKWDTHPTSVPVFVSGGRAVFPDGNDVYLDSNTLIPFPADEQWGAEMLFNIQTGADLGTNTFRAHLLLGTDLAFVAPNSNSSISEFGITLSEGSLAGTFHLDWGGSRYMNDPGETRLYSDLARDVDHTLTMIRNLAGDGFTVQVDALAVQTVSELNALVPEAISIGDPLGGTTLADSTVDFVRLATALPQVPEPSSLTLFAVIGSLVLARRRRRRRQPQRTSK